jgi:epoxyqueuosine reductase
MRAFPTTEAPDDAVRARALALGFHRVGVARAEPLAEDLPRLRAWLDAGRHGEMAWLAREPEARGDVGHLAVLPGARSVVVCALSYHRGDEPSPLRDGEVARYARGRDYHNFLRKRLRKLAAFIRGTFGAQAAPLVDTGPVLERAWARLAGVGFVGKNGCVIAPGLGSYILLGEVVTDLPLRADAPMEERCGACTRCLDACPSGAFAAPWVLDARRCVAYLTIELEGAIPEDLRPAVGARVLGCDVCQEVCPYNRTAPPPAHTTADFAPDPRWSRVDLAALLQLDDERFARLTAGSPAARPGADGMARNAAVALGNVGGRVHLPVLQGVAASHRSATVREAAAWAAARIEGREVR